MPAMKTAGLSSSRSSSPAHRRVPERGRSRRPGSLGRRVAIGHAALLTAARWRGPPAALIEADQGRRQQHRPRRAASPAPRSPRRAPARPRCGPSRITRMRSLIRSTSGRSDEIKQDGTAAPARELDHQPMDVLLGADVDALGRLVHDQDAGSAPSATWPAPPSAGCRRSGSAPCARAPAAGR